MARYKITIDVNKDLLIKNHRINAGIAEDQELPEIEDIIESEISCDPAIAIVEVISTVYDNIAERDSSMWTNRLK